MTAPEPPAGLKMLKAWHSRLSKADRLALLMKQADEMPAVYVTVERAVRTARERATRRARANRDKLIAEIQAVESEP